MRLHIKPHQFITEIARDLVRMAHKSEGLQDWESRHIHVRLLAEDLYGDTEEGALFGAMMALHKDKYLPN